jgi:predicted GNAT superfamily acetyltransferase
VTAFDTFCPMRSRPLFRTIEASDLDRVLAINTANVPEVGAIDLGALEFLVSEAPIALIAEHDHALVGFCVVLAPGSAYSSVNYRWFMKRHPDALYLDRVAFDLSAQGRGWGTAMYDEVGRRMRDRFPDATALTLEVNVDPPNEPSLRFHAKQGFVEVGRQMSHGIEVSLMRRPASPTPSAD